MREVREMRVDLLRRRQLRAQELVADGAEAILIDSAGLSTFASHFGMVADKFGVHWMIIVPNPV